MHHDIDITLAGLPAETPTWLRAEISHSLALLNALDELEQIADSAAFQRWFHTRLLPLFPCQYAIVGVITPKTASRVWMRRCCNNCLPPIRPS